MSAMTALVAMTGIHLDCLLEPHAFVCTPWERGAEALHEGIPFALGDDLLALVVLLELLVVLVVRLVVAGCCRGYSVSS